MMELPWLTQELPSNENDVKGDNDECSEHDQHKSPTKAQSRNGFAMLCIARKAMGYICFPCKETEAQHSTAFTLLQIEGAEFYLRCHTGPYFTPSSFVCLSNICPLLAEKDVVTQNIVLKL